MRENRPPKPRVTAQDVAIGEKLLALRLARGLSQEELGQKIGVTFQQVQKYEIGANRISAARLVDIAEALGVSVTAFFPVSRWGRRERGIVALHAKGAMRLARAHAGIAERGSRAALVAIAEALVRAEARARS